MLQSTVELTKQTPSGEADLEKFKQAWKEIGLSTQQVVRKQAETAIKNVYASAGLAEPQKIVWCGSPFSQGLARAIVLDPKFLTTIIEATWKNAFDATGLDFKKNIADCFRSSMRLFDTGAVKQELLDAIKSDVTATMTERLNATLKESVRASATEAVWNSTWNSVWESVSIPVWRAFDTGMRKTVQSGQKADFEHCMQDSLKDSIGDSVKTEVWENVMDTAWANIRNSIGSQERVMAYENLWRTLQVNVWENVALRIGEAVKACGNDSPQCSGYGQHDAYWLAFYAYFRDAHNLVTETEPVVGLLELAAAGGWFAPHAKLCWICERPSELKLDEAGRLHATAQPALAYPDGWSLHASNGVLQPAPALALA